jgi:hypothetical protein
MLQLKKKLCSLQINSNDIFKTMDTKKPRMNRRNYPTHIFINLCVSRERGAPPQRTNLIRPPRMDGIGLNMMLAHNILSGAQDPNQLPSIAARFSLYAISNSFLVRPPMSPRNALINFHCAN